MIISQLLALLGSMAFFAVVLGLAFIGALAIGCALAYLDSQPVTEDAGETGER